MIFVHIRLTKTVQNDSRVPPADTNAGGPLRGLLIRPDLSRFPKCEIAKNDNASSYTTSGLRVSQTVKRRLQNHVHLQNYPRSLSRRPNGWLDWQRHVLFKTKGLTYARLLQVHPTFFAGKSQSG
jgi:hypothetical protein